ncbi:MAG: VCBS repeat-containing protein [Phycisphaerae bacterium]|nr:VCBS repeat-containing protein [Phycisphaerae bacterium]
MLMRLRMSVPVFVGVAAIGLLATRASAVIKVEMPVSRMYKTARAVIVGKVTGVDATKRVVDVAVTAAMKGDSPGASVRVQVVSPPELVRDVKSGGAMVMFVGRARGGAMAVMHLADTWLLAQGVANTAPQVWRVAKRHNAKQTFPGRTAALARLVGEIKAGKGTILDVMDVAFFRHGIRKAATLGVRKADWLLAANVNGDKRPDLLVGAAGATRLLLAAKGGYEDVTEKWQLRAGDARFRAAGDVNGDGKVDLLLGDTLWINGRGKFTAAARLSLQAKGRALAAALADVNGDAKRDALFLTAAGELHVFANAGSPNAPWRAHPVKTLWQGGDPVATAEFGDWGDTPGPCVLVVRASGITRYALDAAGGPAADFERLTGVNLGRYYERYRNGFKNVRAVALDVNGDKRRDLLVVCDTGGLLLGNRGFGAFLCDYDAGGPLAPHGKQRAQFALTSQMPWTAADLHNDGLDDLIILTADGTLYEVPNKPRR